MACQLRLELLAKVSICGCTGDLLRREDTYVELRLEGTAHPAEGTQTAAVVASDRVDLEHVSGMFTYAEQVSRTDLERQMAAAAEDIPVQHRPGTSGWAGPRQRMNW